MSDPMRRQGAVRLSHPASASTRPSRTPRIVILGEANAGKTWLANALLGARLLPSSFVARTELPTLVEHGARRRLVLERRDGIREPISWDDVESRASDIEYGASRVHMRAPLQTLRRMRLLDTPPLGSGDEDSDRRTRRMCRGADLVIWCTSALQAWKASERILWLSQPAAVRENGVLVLTFSDMLRADQEMQRVLARLNAEAACYFNQVALPSELPAVIARLGAPAACSAR